MDAETIHRIAIYVKNAKIVKQLFYLLNYRYFINTSDYRNDNQMYLLNYRYFINTSDYHYDELVKLYSKKDWQDPLKSIWNTDNLRLIKSFYRLNFYFFDNFKLTHIWILPLPKVI